MSLNIKRKIKFCTVGYMFYDITEKEQFFTSKTVNKFFFIQVLIFQDTNFKDSLGICMYNCVQLEVPHRSHKEPR